MSVKKLYELQYIVKCDFFRASLTHGLDVSVCKNTGLTPFECARVHAEHDVFELVDVSVHYDVVVWECVWV